MSGSLGTWPISPAAKPAKPAPSTSRSSNAANTNSTPRSCMSFQTESAVAVPPIATSFSDDVAHSPTTLGRARERAGSTSSGPLCVAFRRSQCPLELHHLHGDLDQEPVVAPQIEAGELADP